MSKLKLSADSGGGTVALVGPASTTSNANVELKLPVADGSNGQALTTNGSGQLAFSAVSGGAALTGSTDNTICTVSGSNAIQGESNLTFDGTRLSVGGLDPTDYYCDKFVFKASDEDGITIASNAGTLNANENNYIMFASTNSGAGRYDGYVRYGHQSHSFLVSVNNGGGSGKNFFFESDGDFNIGDGNLVVASGHGIDFSATSDGSGTKSSELFNDYEEGSWTPALANGGSATVYSCRYTKIGREVTIHAFAYYSSTPNDSNDFQINGLPFTVSNDTSNTAGGFMYYGASLDVTTIAPYASGNSTAVRFYAINGTGDGGTKENSFFYGTGPAATRYLNFKLIYYTD